MGVARIAVPQIDKRRFGHDSDTEKEKVEIRASTKKTGARRHGASYQCWVLERIFQPWRHPQVALDLEPQGAVTHLALGHTRLGPPSVAQDARLVVGQPVQKGRLQAVAGGDFGYQMNRPV